MPALVMSSQNEKFWTFYYTQIQFFKHQREHLPPKIFEPRAAPAGAIPGLLRPLCNSFLAHFSMNLDFFAGLHLSQVFCN